MAENEARRLPSWINAFEEYTSILSSPAVFRRWAAIGTISAALERRVWVRTQGCNLYPNLYLVLVGPPGVGKSVVLSQVERLLRSVTDLHVAPSNVSSASLIDALGDAKRQIQFPTYEEFNSLVAVASELGVFLPTYEPSFMNLLTKVYDGEPIEDRKRTRNVSVKIERPILGILGGTTPSYLNSFLPDGAWDQGFTSRTIFVFSDERHIVSPFDSEERYAALEKLYVNLLHDLRLIGKLRGRITFEPGAARSIIDWHLAGGPPVPEHGKLLHYIPRRTAHLLKLCMVAAVSRNSLEIEQRDFDDALGWLTHAESLMPDIFKSMGASGDSQVMDDAWYQVYASYMKDKALIPEREIVHFIQKRVPHHSVMRVLDIMIRTGSVEQVGFGPEGKPLYRPRPKAIK